MNYLAIRHMNALLDSNKARDEMNSRLVAAYKENEKLRNLLAEKIMEYAEKGAE